MIVNWTDEALADLASELEFVFDQSPERAVNLARRIEQAEQTLQIYPRAATYISEFDVYEKYIPRTRNLLIYRLDEKHGEILVVALYNTSRDPRKKPFVR